MDCEKFDQHVMDALYDELDELTHAALKRHMDGCSRCASAFQGLRATRDVGVLPLEEPSEGLEDRILAAALAAQRKTPWHRKALRGLAWAGSHAMRPQLAMAALFVLVIGSSLLLLRPKPASMPSPVRVTERGVPAPEPSDNAGSPDRAPALEAQAAAAPTVASPAPIAGRDDRAQAAAADSVYEEEQGSKSKAEGSKEAKLGDAQAALAMARSVRQSSGCDSAVKAYNDVGARFPATVAAADAMWEAASCYKSMGQGDKARELYMALRSYSSYRDRAEAEIGEPEMNSNMGNAMASRAAAAPKAAAPAPPPPATKPAGKPPVAAEQAAPPATSPGGGSDSRATSAPKKAAAPADAVGF